MSAKTIRRHRERCVQVLASANTTSYEDWTNLEARENARGTTLADGTDEMISSDSDEDHINGRPSKRCRTQAGREIHRQPEHVSIVYVSVSYTSFYWH